MRQNPKLAKSNLCDCIPQVGHCPNLCSCCYFNNGFYRTLDKPLIPTLKEVGDKIVRVNSGHDSNLQKPLVLRTTKKYKKKFYNTSIHDFNFPAPVAYTINGRNTDSKNPVYDVDRTEYKNVMTIRYRVNTWNGAGLVKVVDYFTGDRKVPVLLTFMRYQLYEQLNDPNDYEYKKHILNGYWSIKEEPWNKIVNKYKDNPLVFVCGKTYGNSYCKDCGNCEKLYNEFMNKGEKC